MNLLDIFPSSLPDIFLFMLACYMFLPQPVYDLLHNNLKHLLHILMAFYLYSPFPYPPQTKLEESLPLWCWCRQCAADN